MENKVVQQLQIVSRDTVDPTISIQPVVFISPDGTVVGLLAPGDTVGTGYEVATVAADLEDTDTLLEMIGKLEKRVADLEAAP